MDSLAPVLVLLGAVGCSQAAPLDSGKSGGLSDDGADTNLPLDTAVPEPRDPNADVVLNELLSGDSEGGPDWIELYNRGTAVADLTGWQLTDALDDDDTPAWTLPDNTTIGVQAHLVVFADGDGGGGLRADFKLSRDGETVTLLDSAGRIAGEVDCPPLLDDQSYGRAADGGDPWVVLATPSQGASNWAANP